MLATLVLLAFSPAAQSAPPPSPFEIVRTWTGNILDHLGIGISALGDVNGDGVPDFILGAMQGAYCFYFGPGYAQVVSGKDGSVLYTVRGTDKEGDCGDAYGDTIAALGDLDKDGVPDFAVGAWRYEEYRGFVTVYSGKRGKVLATLYGTFGEARTVLTEIEKPARPPGHCGWFGGEGFGRALVGLGDLDADGVPDFAVGGDSDFSPTWIVSGATFSVRGPVVGQVLSRNDSAKAVDDGDLCVHEFRDKFRHVSSTTLAITKAFTTEPGERAFDCGDLDHDGWPDFVKAQGRYDTAERGPATQLPVEIVSGKDGTDLFKLELPCPGRPREPLAGTLGDLDGDGSPEVYVKVHVISVGSLLWILDGKTGAVVAKDTRDDWTFGSRIVPLGDIDHDGRPEFLLSDYESEQGARCGGAVHLVHIRLSRH
jgi:hypothetical protein